MSAAPPLSIRWTASEAEFEASAQVVVRLMLLDEAYISHSEIQWGLSPDGRRWAGDAPARLQAYLGWVRSSADARLAVASEPSGDILGACIVTTEVDMPGRFATIQDMVVEPHARGRGVGAALLAFVEADAVRQGCRWLFLESGVRNARAHGFFEREGLAPTSHTFAKPLTPDAGASP